MVFDLTIPMKEPRFVIQVWDRDFIGPNDAIAEAVLNFRSLLNRAFKEDPRTGERIKMDRQWIELHHPNYEGPQGRVEMSVEIVPEEVARLHPVGKGRDEPNTDPVLPPPDRPERSFNPLRVDKWVSFGLKTFWRAHRCKIITILIFLILLAIGIPVILFVLKIIGPGNRSEAAPAV
jgi:hypothetical protein